MYFCVIASVICRNSFIESCLSVVINYYINTATQVLHPDKCSVDTRQERSRSQDYRRRTISGGRQGTSSPFCSRLVHDQISVLLSSFQIVKLFGRFLFVLHSLSLNTTVVFSFSQILVTSNDSRIRLYDLRDLTLTCKYRGCANNSSQIKASFRSATLRPTIFTSNSTFTRRQIVKDCFFGCNEI